MKTVYDEMGRSMVEFDGPLHFVETNLRGRETIREMTEVIAEDLFAAREQGKNTYSGEKIRRMAYEKARSLVAEKAAQYERERGF